MFYVKYSINNPEQSVKSVPEGYDPMNVIFKAEFQDKQSAQLFWDTIYYLRNTYVVKTGRPM